MAQSSALLSRPFWNLGNTLVLPIMSDGNGDGIPTLRSVVSLSLPIIIFLDTIIAEKDSSNARSLGEDQLSIFRSIEGSLAGMGVDGRSCLLRLICEMQANAIGRFTVIGEILAVLFTPKRGMNDFLHEYIEAEIAGNEGKDCQETFNTCPFSLITAMKQYNLYAKGQSSFDDKPQDIVGALSNSILDLPKMIFD